MYLKGEYGRSKDNVVSWFKGKCVKILIIFFLLVFIERENKLLVYERVVFRKCK